MAARAPMRNEQPRPVYLGGFRARAPQQRWPAFSASGRREFHQKGGDGHKALRAVCARRAAAIMGFMIAALDP